MANISGTNIASAIRPFTDADTYATAYANEIKGGRHIVADVTARNSIFPDRRDLGMLCYVKNTGKTYKLINNPATDTTKDSDWGSESITASDIELTDGETVEEKFSTIESKMDRNIVFKISPVRVGVDGTEFACPFAAKITSICATLPVDTVLSSEFCARLEVYKNSAWTKIDDVYIEPADKNKGVKTLITPYDLAQYDTLRVNVIQSQSVFKNLMVVVTITPN